ncbi:hypothetical protein MRX96_041415 [Rhipicephalus microplus]
MAGRQKLKDHEAALFRRTLGEDQPTSSFSCGGQPLAPGPLHPSLPGPSRQPFAARLYYTAAGPKII